MVLMKTIAIITEYNPFHLGHLSQIEYVKDTFGDEYKIIVIMSGNFVQRGEPAIMEKYSRSRLAVENGVSLVIELPTVFSSASAREFARAGVQTIAASGVTRDIICGAENPELRDTFENISDVLAKDEPKYTSLLKEKLEEGNNFATARELSLQELLSEESASVSTILSNSNNILALEYLLAIKELGLSEKLSLHFSPRKGADELDTEISGVQASASAVRETTLGANSKAELIKALEYQLPPRVLAELIARDYPQYDNFALATQKDFLIEDVDFLEQFRDVDSDLANRLKNTAEDYLYGKTNNLDFFSLASTRYYPLSRIKRSALAKVLGIKKSDWDAIQEQGPAFLNLLACDKDGRYLIKLMRRFASLPITVKNSDLLETLNNNLDTSKIQQDINLRSDALYNLFSEEVDKGIFSEHLYILNKR